jgi:uncharacterized protein (DUF4415 family)
MKQNHIGDPMRDEYNFSKAKKNPYSKKLKKQVTLRMNSEVIDYFKHLSEDTGITYQNLINFFLQDCVEHKKKPKMTWSP